MGVNVLKNRPRIAALAVGCTLLLGACSSSTPAPAVPSVPATAPVTVSTSAAPSIAPAPVVAPGPVVVAASGTAPIACCKAVPAHTVAPKPAPKPSPKPKPKPKPVVVTPPAPVVPAPYNDADHITPGMVRCYRDGGSIGPWETLDGKIITPTEITNLPDGHTYCLA